MNKKKLSIFKIQKSSDGSKMLINNKKRTMVGELPYDHVLDVRFKGKDTIYILGHYNSDGLLFIEQRVSDRSW